MNHLFKYSCIFQLLYIYILLLAFLLLTVIRFFCYCLLHSHVRWDSVNNFNVWFYLERLLRLFICRNCCLSIFGMVGSVFDFWQINKFPLVVSHTFYLTDRCAKGLWILDGFNYVLLWMFKHLKVILSNG